MIQPASRTRHTFHGASWKPDAILALAKPSPGNWRRNKMTNVSDAMLHPDPDIEAWLRVRKIAGQAIDPETAEVHWSYSDVSDPYGVYPPAPDEEYCVGRVYWARAPESDVWVAFGDLNEATRDRLWEKHRDKLVLPPGLWG
jgi:hypothetical protein